MALTVSRTTETRQSDAIPFLFSRWKPVALLTLLGGVIGLATGFVLPKQYESEATVYVHDNTLNKAAVAADMMGIQLGGGGTSSEYLISVLESRPLKKLVAHKLQPADVKKLELDEKPLPVQVKSDKRKGSLVVECRTYSPYLSSSIVNLMLDNLSRVMVSSSKRKTDYLSRRLDETQTDLNAAGQKLRRFEETHDIAMLDEDTKAGIEKLNNLEADQMKLDASIKAIDSELVNSADPEALVELKVRRRSEQSSRNYVAAKVAGLHRQMAGLPAVAQQYATLARQVTVLEKTFEQLSAHYQTTALSQVGEDGDYDIIERAEPVLRPASPKKLWTAIMGAMLAGLAACAVLYVRSGGEVSEAEITEQAA